MASRHVSFRIADPTFRRLEERRREAGQTRSHLANQLLDEGLRMEDHPGVAFRSGPTGRRAALIGGPDIWEVIGVFRELEARGEQAIRRTAELTALAPAQVRAAVRYYAEYPDEIDSWLERVRSEAERAQAAWRREQGLVA